MMICIISSNIVVSVRIQTTIPADGTNTVREICCVHARTDVFLVLCLRVSVAITNYERGDDLGCEKLTHEIVSITRSTY